VVHSFATDRVVLLSTVPSPPGSRVLGTLDGESRDPLRVKVHSCKKEDSGMFRIEGRTIDLSRATRSRIEATLHVIGEAKPGE
jgi:hypothetical protein